MDLSGETLVPAPGTGVPLGDTAINAPLLVRALPGNSGQVYVRAGLAAAGIALAAGETITFQRVSSLTSIRIDADAAGEGAAWIVLAL
jgi:hypothetical protein